jgi:alpha-tubulin suppressor-like RCC1 family protein
MMAGGTRLGGWIAGGALISLTAGLGALGASPASAASAAPARPAPSVAAGNAHSCVLHGGRAYCWGENDDGQLGDGTTADSSVPVPVDTSGALAGKTLTQISAGGGGGLDTCALDSASQVFCWGSDFDGGLGDGGSGGGSSAVPVAVDKGGALAGKTITQVSTGSDGGCVLDSAGAVFCWGDNDSGELGDGGTASSSVPVAVRTSGVLAGQALTQVTAGLQDTCGLDHAGAAFCWGDNGSQELGDGGSEPFSAVPVAVDTSGVLAGQALTQISAGWQYECAVDAAGAAFCWGTGALGTASTFDSGVPVAVAAGAVAGRPLAQVSVGFGAACALDRAGAAFCWGDNGSGELGDGSTVSSATPVAVSTTGVLAGQVLTQITAGAFHACAADAANATFCWGDNNQGDLGNGSTVQSNVPVLAGPQAPAGVTAQPGTGTAAVSWTAPARLDGGTVTGYTATAAPGGAACATTGATACTVAGLTGGVTYSVSVVAHTTVGDSGASAPVTVTPRSAAAAAGPIVSGYRATLCVTDAGDSAANDTKIVIGPCDGGAAQHWAVETDGTVRINGKCLDVFRDEKTSKAPVDLWTCTGGTSQQWRPAAGTLVNPVSGKCLDDPRLSITAGTQLEIYTCDASAGQQWKLP